MATVREQVGLPPLTGDEPVVTWKAFSETSPLIYAWIETNFDIAEGDPGCDYALYEAIEALIKENYEHGNSTE